MISLYTLFASSSIRVAKRMTAITMCLKSELFDLRVGYANPYSNALRLSVFDVGTGQK